MAPKRSALGSSTKLLAGSDADPPRGISRAQPGGLSRGYVGECQCLRAACSGGVAKARFDAYVEAASDYSRAFARLWHYCYGVSTPDVTGEVTRYWMIHSFLAPVGPPHLL
jgi:hypothetical protein